ncbi:MAG: sigma-70 family RNA polymerase sigma factor [Acidobacteria bacterium]|nr:sigma-70 family RNA polymerase sigma factor [Acidobacteriota bacterium]
MAEPIVDIELEHGVEEPEGLPDIRDVYFEDDHHLVERLQSGDEAAYETLIARFQHPVYNLVSRLMTDGDDACDVVQEVFLKVFRNVASFRAECSLKTWIYRIAVNEAYNHRRWFVRHRRPEVGLEQESEVGTTYHDRLPDRSRTPFDVALGHEEQALIEEALAHLNPKFRSCVVLRDIEDLSYEEIADIEGISLGTVKSRILRGRETLRRTLAGRLEPGPALDWTPQPAE